MAVEIVTAGVNEDGTCMVEKDYLKWAEDMSLRQASCQYKYFLKRFEDAEKKVLLGKPCKANIIVLVKRLRMLGYVLKRDSSPKHFFRTFGRRTTRHVTMVLGVFNGTSSLLTDLIEKQKKNNS